MHHKTALQHSSRHAERRDDTNGGSVGSRDGLSPPARHLCWRFDARSLYATTNRSSKRSPNPATIDSRWPRTKTSRLRSTSPPPSGWRGSCTSMRCIRGPTPSPHAELPADVGSNALGQGSRVHLVRLVGHPRRSRLACCRSTRRSRSPTGRTGCGAYTGSSAASTVTSSTTWARTTSRNRGRSTELDEIARRWPRPHPSVRKHPSPGRSRLSASRRKGLRDPALRGHATNTCGPRSLQRGTQGSSSPSTTATRSGRSWRFRSATRCSHT